MDSALGSFTVGFLITGLTGFIQLGLNFLTAGWPTRPRWVAIVGAMTLGIGGAFLFALANRIAVDSAIAAQLVIVGFFSAAGAAGLNFQAVKAQQAKTAAAGTSEIQQRLVGPTRSTESPLWRERDT